MLLDMISTLLCDFFMLRGASVVGGPPLLKIEIDLAVFRRALPPKPRPCPLGVGRRMEICCRVASMEGVRLIEGVWLIPFGQSLGISGVGANRRRGGELSRKGSGLLGLA